MAFLTLACWAFSCLLLFLRVSPAFALAPPFTLTHMPARFRTLPGLGLSAAIVSAHPQATAVDGLSLGQLVK
ncbi:hypothetical protein [Phenylobacterium aquaticum]|uniref:hypothetical protein n=1 Tax=Phenylobacterium aquaticum TaxID=1763816 RepID=UPI001F5D4289|nr:hypothetical protein [Phenylobacterium aquaticum]MCI3133681.1 hypothetical protein [Phenylobacterium aquaticum]